MNKQSYRIVFNKARSLLMAVSETASAQGKASGQTQGQDPIAQENSLPGARFSMAYELSQQSWLPRPVARALSAVLIFSLQFSAILPSLMSQRAYAAGPSATTITADPNAAGNLRPTVLTTSSGLAQVNIQTPNAAGVSVNHYSQFDVGSNGAILNNSRTNAQTQTGGWVTGNPWLAGGSAQTILNQVNSTNPSQLNGYVEVAGQRANVILANPNGISVNGGGFINAARTTLTTGTPNFDTTGAISGYSVRQGAVSVDGLGLDTSTADFTDIISRSVSVNAGVWANKLKITTGVNDVDTNNTSAVPVAGAGTGAAPSFALDSSALGGMYAGAITLQGTESGVGVRNAGQIGASAGQVQISADGLLTNSGKITASADLLVNTTATGGGGVANSGTLYAGGATQITTQGSVANTGTGLIAAQGNTSITASGAASQLTNDKNATIAAGLNPDGTLGSTGNLNLSATLGMSGNGQMIAGGAYAATGQSLNVAGANINAASVNLTATAGNLNATGASLTGRDSLSASTTQTLQTDGAVLQSNQLNLSAQAISNVGGQLLQTGTADMNIAVPGSIDNTGGTISANAQNLHLSAASINNTSGKLQHVGSGTFSVSANQALNNTQGQIASNQNLNLSAAELNNSQGAVQTGGNAALTLGTLRNANGTVTTGQDLQINAASVNNSGTLYAAGQQQLNVTGGLSNTGTIAAQKNTTITAQTINSAPVQGSGGLLGAGIKTDGTLANSGDLTVTTRGASTSGAPALSATGQNLAGGQLTLQGDAINIAASQTQAQNILLNASAGDVNAAGATLSAAVGNLTVQAGGATQTLVTDNAHLLANQLNINVGKLSNRAGEIVQSGSADSTLVAQSLDNTAGRMASAATNWTFQTTNFNNTNGGRIEHAADSAAPSSLTLTAQNANNAGGAVLSNGALNLQAGSLNNDAGTISAHQVSLASTGALSNRAGQIVQSGTAATTFNVAGALDNSGGVIASNGHTTLNAQSLSNQAGSVQAAGTTSVPANLTVILTGLLDNSAKGNLQATGDSLVQAASVNNNAGSITAGGKLNIAAQTALNNAAGTLASVGSAQVSAGTLDNTGGTIASVKDKLSITSFAAANNSGGQIEAAGDVQFTSTALNNAQGTVIGQNVQLNTQGGALTNTQGGLIAARSALTVNSGALDNTGGTFQSAGGMSLNTQGQSLANAASANTSNPGGVIYSGAELNITSGALSNCAGGAILSGGDTSITASGLVNSATIGSQGKLSITAPLVNTGGQLLAQTDLSINSGAAVLDNSGGLIRANGSATLNAATLLNTNTQGLAADGSASQGIEGNNILISADTLQNQSGSLRGGDLLSITSGGTVSNSQGQISAAGTASITDANTAARTLALTNTDGNIIAGKQLNILAASASGDGKLQSTGDLSIDLSSDFVNTGKIIANHNASFSTSGNLVNSGTFNAGNTLSVQANNIDNQASGQISAATTNVIAQNTLTNRGLIDGSEVYVRANELNNTGTGRVYGDHLAIQAGTLNNSAEGGVAAVIAARSRLDLGVGTVNNTDHALIFSGGDMVIGATLDDAHHATGQAQAINNASATIQAMGHGLLNAAKIINTNAHFATELQTPTTGAPNAFTVSADGQTYDGSQVFVIAGDGVTTFPGDWRRDNHDYSLVTPSTKYPADKWPTMPTEGRPPILNFAPGSQYFAGGTLYSGGENGSSIYVPEQTVYKYTNANDPIWALFSVQPPSTAFPGDPPVQPTARAYDCGDGSCISEPTRQELDDYAAAKAVYDIAIAPWTQAYALLNPKLVDYNADAATRLHENWIVTTLTSSSTQETKVTQTDPGQILVGGNLTLMGQSTINDKSQIVVGGQFNPAGTHLQNLGATGTKIKTEAGTAYQSSLNSRWDGSVERDWAPTDYTPAPFTTTFNLAIGTVDNAVSASTAPTIQSVNILAVTDKAYVDQRVFKLLQPLSQSANVTATVGAVSSAAATLPTAANPIRTVSLVEKTGAKPGAVQLVVRTSLVNPTLPNNALYHINAGNSTQPLIETDPRFANYKDWLGSDYMMKALGLDPSAIGKRLGDGFYEQQLLTQQIIQLTGYRYLAGYSNDETEYRALMDAGVTFAKRFNLTPGIALTEAQMAQLTSDMVWLVSKTVTLADGTRQTVLVPQVYARVKAGDIDGSGTLMSGDTVAGTLTGDLVNGGTIAGRTAVNLAANNLANTGLITGEDIGLRAANDLSNIGGQITAGRSADIAAGHNLTIASTTQTSSSSQGTRVNLDRIAGIYVGGASSVDANGNTITPRLNLSAGNLLSVNGANVGTSPNGTVTLTGKDLSLGTVATSYSQNTVWDANNYIKQANSQDKGSTITGGNVLLAASNDITARAATVSAQNALIATAGNDILLSTAHSTSQEQHSEQRTQSSGLFSKETTLRQSSKNTDTELGNSLDGNTVTLQAGRDIGITASTVVAQQDLTASAGRNLTVQAGTTTTSADQYSKTTEKGFLSGGGALGFTYGQRITTVDQKVDASSQGGTAQTTGNQERSSLGSINGSVKLTAGNALQVSGSDLQAQQDITAQGASVSIDTSQDKNKTQTETKMRQDGFTLAVGGSVVSAAQAVQGLAEAGSNTHNSRMQALAMAGQALTAAQAAAAAVAAPSVSFSLTLGHSESTTQQTDTNSYNNASGITAGRDVKVIATGKGEISNADSGNITITGSDVNAGRNIALNAAKDITVQSAQDLEAHKQDNNSWSAGAGVAVAVSSGGASAGFNGQASISLGAENGQGSTQVNSHLKAGNTVSLTSGRDTNLQGAVVSGDSVTADVGRNLNLESRQDTASFDSRQFSASINATVGYGASVSASANMAKAKTDYASVTEQTGIQAGSGGFQINVKGNTDLKGATIASNQEAIDNNKNSLTTASLTQSNIQNHSSADGFSAGASGGYSGGGTEAVKDDKGNVVTDKQGNVVRTENMSSLGGMKMTDQGNAGVSKSGSFGAMSESDSSTTKSGISIATLSIGGKTTAAGEAATDTSGKTIDTSVRTGQSNAATLAKPTSAAEMTANLAIVQSFGAQASKAIGDFAATQTRAASVLHTQAEDVKATDPAKAEALNAQAQSLEDKWGDSGTLRLLAHTTVGALTGGNAGAAGAALGTLTAPLAAEQLSKANITGPLADTLTALASTAAGALAGTAIGGASGVASGGATAFNEVVNNYLAHAQATRLAELRVKQLAGKLTAAELQEMKTLVMEDKASNAALDRACSKPSIEACAGELAKVKIAAASYDGTNAGFDATGTIGKKQSEAQTLSDLYTNRVNNAQSYNNIVGAGKVIAGIPVGVVQLTATIAKSIDGDKQAQAQLSDMVKAAGEFLSAPIDNTQKAIADTLARANALEAAGQKDQAQQMRAELVTNGYFVVTGVGGLAVGATKLGLAAKAGVVSKIETIAGAAQAAKAAEAEIAAARISNNFYADGASSNPIGLNTSAGVIPANPNKTTTVLGRHNPDMSSVIDIQMGAVKTEDFGARPGGFNVLNVDNAVESAAGPQFFEKINKPFLDQALKRGDDVALATVPQKIDDVIASNGALKGNFAKELDYLVKNNYKPVNISPAKWSEIKGWFK